MKDTIEDAFLAGIFPSLRPIWHNYKVFVLSLEVAK